MALLKGLWWVVKSTFKLALVFILVLGAMWAFGFVSAAIDGGASPANPVTIAELRLRQNLSDRNSLTRHGYKTYVDLVAKAMK
ncbi:MAG: hypothetical protein IJ173_01310 [Kiritimatiellae bacterium]|nr:hypothetical protein [Kiritimatiellia bacterium]